MAYGKENAIKAMENIIGLKRQWQIADNVKSEQSEAMKREVKNNAEKYYNELIANGYKTAANNLKNSNYEQAKKYANNYYTKTGRSQFRPYMYEKGKAWGLTNEDIDSLTNFDSETGEVIFAGKNIGKPDGIAYNRSYFNSDYLDEVWDNYVKDSGITPSKDSMADQMSYKAMNYLDNLADQQTGNRDYIMNTGKEQRQRKDDFIESQQNANIFKTDAAKTIMDKFNYMGGVAGGDAVASGAASNGGNIDSFSAANRARQQLAYTSAGADAVIAEYQNRMNNIMDTLKSIDSQNLNEYGALNLSHESGRETAQMYSDNAKQLRADVDTEKKTDQAIENDKSYNWREEAATKGYFTDYSDNPFLNEDGSVKNEDRDYTAIYNEAKANGDEKTAAWASEAAFQKIQANPEKYGQYYDPKIHKPRENNRTDTATVKLADKEIEAEKWKATLDSDTQIKLQEMVNEITKYGYDKQEVMAKIQASATTTVAQINASVAREEIASNERVSEDTNYTTRYVNELSYLLGTGEITANMIMNENDNVTSIIKTRIETGADITMTGMNNQAGIESLKIGNGYYDSGDGEKKNSNSGVTSSSGGKAPVVTDNSGDKSTTVTDNVVKSIADGLNKDFKESYGDQYTALKKNKDGTYTKGNVDSDYIVLNVLNNTDLTIEQKNYVLKDKFGITQKQIDAVRDDNHYRRAQDDWNWP